jgi:hypothetical protein
MLSGLDLTENEIITIRFKKSQKIDSVEILPKSNLNSSSVAYSKTNGDIYVLEGVKLNFDTLSHLRSSISFL